MEKEFGRILQRYGLVVPGDHILVAVSGGPDSVALLHLLRLFSEPLNLHLYAAHLDHAMRPESPFDAAFVEKLCRQWGVPLETTRIDVPALAAKQRQNIEEAAREARREFLRDAARRHGCRLIALGHHRGDQAETFLQRLLRGSGPTGLAGMKLQCGPFIRPLLPFGRGQILAHLHYHNLPHVEDASNTDLAYTRNRIRHDLLPRLRELSPAIESHLARLSRRLGQEEDFWRRQVDRQLTALCRVDDGLRLDRRRLLELHPALLSRTLRGALERVRGDLRGITAAHLEAVEDLLHGGRPQGEIHLPRVWVGRRYEELWLRCAAPAATAPSELAIPGPGSYSLPDGRTLRVGEASASHDESRFAVEFAADCVHFPLVVRTPRAGDRFSPEGLGGSKKLKDFFIDAKIPREVRAACLLVVGEEVLWVVGMRRCAGMHESVVGGRVLRLVVSGPGVATINL